jgi:hypothetical protein
VKKEGSRVSFRAALQYVVDPGNSSWNQLLTELSQLSKIVEQSANDRNHGSSSTAAPQLRER